LLNQVAELSLFRWLYTLSRYSTVYCCCFHGYVLISLD